MVDFAGATPAYSSHHGGAITPRYFIIHGTSAGTQQAALDVAHDFGGYSADQATADAKNIAGTNPNSATYAIGRAGDVVQIVGEYLQAWTQGVITGTPGTGGPAAGQHDPWWVGDPNDVCNAVELVNANGNGLAPSPPQYAALLALLADWCARHGVGCHPADATDGITGHFSVDPIERAFCPGANFPWAQLFADLRTRTLRKLPNAVGMSEFNRDVVNGVLINGDCTQAAHLACLHSIDPARWPATADALNALVRRDIAAGLAGASGSQDGPGLAQSLRTDGVPFRQFLPGDWQAELAQYGGIRPMIFQVAHAGGALPGDEPGVQGHAIACLAWNPAHNAGLFCDGDNRAATALVRYSLAQLVAAQPFAVTTIDIEPRAQVPGPGVHTMPVPAGWTDDGTTLRAPNGQAVIAGFRDFVIDPQGARPPWLPGDQPIEREHPQAQLELSNPSLGGGTQQTFHFSLLGYTPARGVIREYVGDELLATRKALADAQAQVAALKDQIAAAQAAPVAPPQPQGPDPKLVADAQAIQQIKAIVAPL